jgi:hypothetical protein
MKRRQRQRVPHVEAPGEPLSPFDAVAAEERPYDPDHPVNELRDTPESYRDRIEAAVRARHEARGAPFLEPTDPERVRVVGAWNDGRVGWRSIVADVPLDVLREHATAEHEPDTLDVVLGHMADELELLSEGV